MPITPLAQGSQKKTIAHYAYRVLKWVAHLIKSAVVWMLKFYIKCIVGIFLLVTIVSSSVGQSDDEGGEAPLNFWELFFVEDCPEYNTGFDQDAGCLKPGVHYLVLDLSHISAHRDPGKSNVSYQAGQFVHQIETVTQLDYICQQAVLDDQIGGVLFLVQDPTDDFSLVEPIRACMALVKKSQKKTLFAAPSVYSPYAQVWGLAMALDLDQRWFYGMELPQISLATPNGAIRYKGGLNKLFGTPVYRYSTGKNKTSGEDLMRTGPSPEAYESHRIMYRRFHQKVKRWLLQAVPEGNRPWAKQRLLEQALITAEVAQAQGILPRHQYLSAKELPDRVADYFQEPQAALENGGLGANKHLPTFVSGAIYLALLEKLYKAKKKAFENGKLAHIYLEGPIVRAADEAGSMACITYGKVRKMLEAAENDPTTKAILITIDSPGGDAETSWEIADLIEQVEARCNKKIYMYGEGFTASGGLMIALGAKRRFLAPETISGSIGVVASSWMLNMEHAVQLVAQGILSKEALSGCLPLIKDYTTHQPEYDDFDPSNSDAPTKINRDRVYPTPLAEQAGLHAQSLEEQRADRQAYLRTMAHEIDDFFWRFVQERLNPSAFSLFDRKEDTGKVFDPKEAVRRGLFQEVLPLEDLYQKIASDLGYSRLVHWANDPSEYDQALLIDDYSYPQSDTVDRYTLSTFFKKWFLLQTHKVLSEIVLEEVNRLNKFSYEQRYDFKAEHLDPYAPEASI